jgi:CubicO group peptidase (beta-lactamase class C family)
MADAQARVQAVLDELIERGVERGLQVAAYYDGELIADAWAGVADAETGRHVDGDTLFTVWSVTKGITATAIHILAERGTLDYDTPIAIYWPEFAANGKAQITLRQALSHTAGMPMLPEGVELTNWDAMCAAIAELAPMWEPGTAMGYHAVSYGWIVGETARRADGRPFADIVRDEICEPLGIKTLFLGIPDEVEPHVARIEAAVVSDPGQPVDPRVRQIIGPLASTPPHEWANRPEVRRASIPAAGGIMNARAIARHYAALISDGVDGVRLLTPERLRLATALQYEGEDVLTGGRHHKALGYHLGETLSPMSERSSAFGHGGAGGSLGFADPEHRFAFGLSKTRMTDSARAEDAAAFLAARAIREALGIPER